MERKLGVCRSNTGSLKEMSNTLDAAKASITICSLRSSFGHSPDLEWRNNCRTSETKLEAEGPPTASWLKLTVCRQQCLLWFGSWGWLEDEAWVLGHDWQLPQRQLWDQISPQLFVSSWLQIPRSADHDWRRDDTVSSNWTDEMSWWELNSRKDDENWVFRFLQSNSQSVI